ncbi:MAG: IS3 family transposase, partial [Gammaproteobacteria bacterium]
MSAAQALGRRVGRKAACRALNLPRASFYRHLRPNAIPPAPRPKPSRALDDAERQAVMDTLHSERFRDQAPSQVYATLLDECTYLC